MVMDEINFTAKSHPTLLQSDWDVIKCGACIGAIEGACIGLIVGGAIIAAPEEITIAGVMAAIAILGFEVDGKRVIEWLVEAAKAGINSVNALAKFLCKKLGACS